MTFDELAQLPQSERDDMLIQAVAIISVQPRFGDRTPHEIFDILAKQAAEIKAEGHSDRSHAGLCKPVQQLDGPL